MVQCLYFISLYNKTIIFCTYIHTHHTHATHYYTRFPWGFTVYLCIVATFSIVYMSFRLAGHFTAFVIFNHVVFLCCQLDSVIRSCIVFACHLEFHSRLVCFERRCFHSSPEVTFSPLFFFMCITCADYWSRVSVFFLLLFLSYFITGGFLCQTMNN